jgi:hypothetical protein
MTARRQAAVIAMAAIGLLVVGCGDDSRVSSETRDTQDIGYWFVMTDGIDLMAFGDGTLLTDGSGISQLLDRFTGAVLDSGENDPDGVLDGQPDEPVVSVPMDSAVLDVRVEDHVVVDDGEEVPRVEFGRSLRAGDYLLESVDQGLVVKDGHSRTWEFLDVEGESFFEPTEIFVVEGWAYAGLANGQLLALQLDAPSLDAAAEDWSDQFAREPLNAEPQTVAAITAGMQAYVDALRSLDVASIKAASSQRCLRAADWTSMTEQLAAATEADRNEAASLRGEIRVESVKGNSADVVFTGLNNQLPMRFVLENSGWVIDEC